MRSIVNVVMRGVWPSTTAIEALSPISKEKSPRRETCTPALSNFTRRRAIEPIGLKNVANLGLLALQQNKLEEAEAYSQQGLNVCRELGDMPGISGHYQGLGMVYLGQNRLAEAEDILKKGIEIEERLQRDAVAHHYGVLGAYIARRVDLMRRKKCIVGRWPSNEIRP